MTALGRFIRRACIIAGGRAPVRREHARRGDDRHVHGGRRESRTPDADRYDISSVEKVGEDLWRFNARMDCCGMGKSGTVPVVVPMRWVGDTPVIMMTDTSLPGLGTFTVRVFFHGDRYAGTWQRGAVGGHVSGRIEKLGRLN